LKAAFSGFILLWFIFLRKGELQEEHKKLCKFMLSGSRLEAGLYPIVNLRIIKPGVVWGKEPESG